MNKVINTIWIILITLISSNCNNKSEIDITGSWIGVHRLVFVNDNKDSIFDFLPIILEIDSDTITTYSLEYNFHSAIDSINKHSYFIKDSSLVSFTNGDSNIMTIRVASNNDLVLSNEKKYTRYQNIIPRNTDNQKINLINKQYKVIQYDVIIDTFEFINQFNIFSYNSSELRHPTILNWNISKYKGHSLFCIESWIYPPFFINEIEQNKFELKQKPANKSSIRLEEIERHQTDNKLLLLGTWTGNSTKPKTEITFKFDSDSLTMNDITGQKNIRIPFLLSLAENFIIIPYNREISGSMFYQIQKLDKDSLILKRRSQVKGNLLLKKEE